MCAETEARAAETSMLSSGDGHERSVEATRKFPASFCNDCGGDKPDIVPGVSAEGVPLRLPAVPGKS